MKIALDYREAIAPNRAGKGEYIYQLTKSMLDSSPDIEFVLLVDGPVSTKAPAGNCRFVEIPVRGAMWHLVVALWLSTFAKVDLFFATASVIIPAFSVRVPVVTTLFDFTSWRFPNTHYAHAHWIERAFMKRALLRSRALVAISEFTKEEAVDLFGVDPQKIFVTPLAVDTQVFKYETLSASRVEQLRTKYRLPDKYILCLATIEPRKNMMAVVEAYHRIQKQFPELKLVLAGAKGWHSESIYQNAGQGVMFTGYIDDADRPAIYQLAEVFAFPSFYEGFGLPPLEAMAVGTPTIVSDRASLPEVAGDVAVQVRLENPNNLQEALIQLLTLSPEQKVAWSKSARKWAENFSWKATATATIKVLIESR